jgi:hypothetical protein
MIILINNSNKIFSVQYVNGAQVFKKEILQNSLAAYNNLTTDSQIVNQQSLTGNSIGIFDYTNNVFINQGNFATGYAGRIGETGMTITTALLAVPTGYTFVTSANTAMATNTISATTVGNTVDVAFSGAGVSTTAWVNAINATAFSGFGITIFGNCLTTFITSAGTSTFSLSSSTASSNVSTAYFIGDNVKREQYNVYDSFNLNATYATLSGLTA